MDIAASIQKITEKIITKLCIALKSEYKINNLCLAGGVALNCVVNGQILKNKIFEKIWIQPAAGDAGGALGAALAYWHIQLNKKRIINEKDSMSGSYLGPSYKNEEIKKQLEEVGANFEILKYKNLIEKTAHDLKNSNAVGWFQGRMEFGPRALGSRSIIADPRSPVMQKNLNLKVKYRESFRPFAPSILREDLDEWFDLNCDSPYMLLVANIKKNKQKKMTKKEMGLFGIEKLNIVRSELPAITHVNYSARIQTVHIDTNKKFHDLLTKFKEITNCPVLINTSFNVRGEPIVNTPLDAFKCFMGSELDVLIIENFYLEKSKQNRSLNKNYKDKFKLD